MKKTANKPDENDSGSARFKQSRSFGVVLREIAPLLHFGWTLVALIAVLAYVGNYLDRRWDTAPWLMLTGLVVAIVAGFYNFFKIVSKFSSKPSGK